MPSPETPATPSTTTAKESPANITLSTPVVPSVAKDAMIAFRQLKCGLRALLTLPAGDWQEITINGQSCEFYVDESIRFGVTSMPSTHHFLVRGREILKLYWYEQYAAITTPQHVYVEYCAFSNGDICVGVWETRCNRPFHALLIYRIETKKCELFTAHDFRKLFKGVHLDPRRSFDIDEVIRYV